MILDQELVQKMADLLIASNRLGEPWRVTSADGYQNQQFPAGMYLITAHDATCYARDGKYASLSTNRMFRLDDGDSVLWLSDSQNDTLTVFAESGGEVRVTPRRQA